MLAPHTAGRNPLRMHTFVRRDIWVANKETSMITTRLLGAAAAGVLMLAACGQNDTTAVNDTTMPETPMATDTVAPAPDQAEMTREAQEFADKAAQANLAEIETAKMAVERATSPDVKAFASLDSLFAQ